MPETPDAATQKHLEEEVSQLRRRLVAALAEIEASSEQRLLIEKNLERAQSEAHLYKAKLNLVQNEKDSQAVLHEKTLEAWREMLLSIGAKHSLPAQEVDQLCSKIEAYGFVKPA